jgi:rhodanese-related sulfurtransferase
MRRALVQMIALVVVGSGVGLAYNALSPKGIPLKGGTEARLAQQGTRMLTVDEVRFYMDKPGTLVVDARSAEEYQLGHIPGALSLPLDNFDAIYPKLSPALKKAKLVILYCGGGSCGTSEELAQKLVQAGFGEDLAIFTDGLPGWMRAKLPIQSGMSH